MALDTADSPVRPNEPVEYESNILTHQICVIVFEPKGFILEKSKRANVGGAEIIWMI